jgi:hypothetical protein
MRRRELHRRGDSFAGAELCGPRSCVAPGGDTDEDVERCIEGGRVDVLFSHDIQAEVPLTDPHLDMGPFPAAAEALAKNRERLQRIADGVRPKL